MPETRRQYVLKQKMEKLKLLLFFHQFSSEKIQTKNEVI